MNWKAYLASAALVFCCSISANAQTTRVAYVDIDRVTDQSERINKAMNNVSARVEDIQKEIEQKRQRLTELKAEIKKGDGVLAQSEMKKRRDESSKLEKDLVDLEYEGRRELQRLDSTLFEPMIKTIVLAIQDVAKEQNIELVVRGEAVIYGAKVADITDDVVKKLNSSDFNPDRSADDEESSDDAKSSDSEKSGSESGASKGDGSSEKSSEASGSKSSESGSLIPNLPLRTRPVDRQQE